MILSNVSIHDALDEGRLILRPEPAPRLKQEGGPKCPYQTSAVDLRLGTEIAYFNDAIPVQIDWTDSVGLGEGWGFLLF
jgi:hypothetical protein